MSKNAVLIAKNKPVESTDYETGLPDWCNIDESISQNTDEGSGSTAEKRKFQDVSQVGVFMAHWWFQ